MKVLWFCSAGLVDVDVRATGTWLDSMSRGLLETAQVDLGIMAFGHVPKLISRDYNQVKQWLVPFRDSPRSNGLPSNNLVADIVSASRSFRPDLIHVWGTEWFWGLLPSRGSIKAPSILTLQGVRYRIAPLYDGGLSKRERCACFGLRNFVKKLMNRMDGKAFYKKWGRFEKEMMVGHRWAICQTPWQEAEMASNNPDATIFRLDLPLRKPFEESKAWIPDISAPQVFCCASRWYSAKGLHVALRSIALLKRKFPSILLRVGGFKPRKGILEDGYENWLSHQVAKLGLDKNVHWLGPLTAAQIADELRNASAMVIPTFIESYSMAFAETMRIGTPCVVSYTGGTGYLGRDEETCLFFPPGDEAMCAYQLERVLTNQDLAALLSSNSRYCATTRHDTRKILQQQLHIYERVLAYSSNSALG